MLGENLKYIYICIERGASGAVVVVVVVVVVVAVVVMVVAAKQAAPAKLPWYGILLWLCRFVRVASADADPLPDPNQDGMIFVALEHARKHLVLYHSLPDAELSGTISALAH